MLYFIENYLKNLSWPVLLILAKNFRPDLAKTIQLLEKKSKCEFYIGVNIYFASCNIELKESASFLNQ
jgi:hypothetical protein